MRRRLIKGALGARASHCGRLYEQVAWARLSRGIAGMKDKLSLTTALASFAAVTALGVGVAGADQVSGIGSAEQRAPLGLSPAIADGEAPICSNGADDD